MPRGSGTLNPQFRRAPAGTIPGWGVSRKTFNDLEDFMADVQGSIQRQREGLDLLVRLMLLTTKGFAQQSAMGPVAYRGRSNPALAYRIPVQRITGRYFAGWTQRRIGPNAWLLYNDAIEAYLIEYGIYQRTRRPILKLSLLQMLKFIQTTRTADRLLEWVLGPRRNGRGQFQSFGSRAFGGAAGMAGPQGRLPG